MSAFYPKGLQALLEAYFLGNAPAGNATDVLVAGVDGNYVFSVAHSTTDDVGEHFVTEAVSLTNATLTGGVLDADDALLTGLTQGTIIPAVVIFAAWDSGSQLLAYIDSESTSTLPITARSTTAQITWDSAGIFKI